MTVQKAARASLADWWNGFWFTEVEPDVFAVLRILFGLAGFFSLAGLLDLSLFWSCTGLVASRESDLCQASSASGRAWFPGYAIFAFSALSFAALTAGYYSRLATVCAFGSVSLIARWNDLPLSAAHQVLRAMLFCLMWVDCGRVWSFDAWRSAAPGDGTVESASRVPIWPLRLIRIQVAAIYLITGLWKLNNVMWRDGTALHYVFENPQFPRFSALASQSLDTWTTLATYSTLVWELTFPLLLLQRTARRWAILVGIVIHLGMWATLELGPFSWVMLASYVAFLDPRYAHRKVARWAASFTPHPILAKSSRRPAGR